MFVKGLVRREAFGDGSASFSFHSFATFPMNAGIFVIYIVRENRRWFVETSEQNIKHPPTKQ